MRLALVMNLHRRLKVVCSSTIWLDMISLKAVAFSKVVPIRMASLVSICENWSNTLLVSGNGSQIMVERETEKEWNPGSGCYGLICDRTVKLLNLR